MVCISFICLINEVTVQVNHFLQVDDTLCVIFKMTSGMEWKRDARWHVPSVQAKSKEEWKSAESIYDFSVKDIDGNEVSLEKYRNHVVLIVNVASK